MPVHLPLDGRYSLGTWSRTSWCTSANSPAFSTRVIAGEFSVRNTSAGDLSPSATNWLPSSVSLPLRSCTPIPVSAVKASAHSVVSDSCWALYTVIVVVEESLDESEPEFEHPDTVIAAAAASATPDIGPIHFILRPFFSAAG